MDFWATYDHTAAAHDILEPFLVYLSTQKLRTPKGLDWLAAQIRSRDPTMTLAAVLRFRQVFGAVWSECVWQIADARASPTKFIVSDHPVTLYNRECGPNHRACHGPGDPDITLNGTHTIFPLSMDKVLILTNKSWATDPYGSAMKKRPNPRLERDAFFNQMEVQIGRQLGEDEVRRINFIIKSRAYRYIAAADREWLYPEEHLPRNVKWSRLGDDHLLFPDPRALHYGGQIIVGFSGGGTMSRDAFGRTLGDPDYGKDELPKAGKDPLGRFQGEFAERFGRIRRGRTWDDPEEDTEGLHAHHLSHTRKAKKEQEAGQARTPPPRKRKKKRRR